jgi:hypothetical protein
MKRFTQQEIAALQKHFRGSRFIERTERVAGREFNYFILPQSCNPDLFDFVLRATGEPGEEYVLGISDSIPGVQRPFPVFHEYVEFMEIGDVPDRCARALEIELAQVPEGLKPAYIPRRTRFFRNLMEQARLKPEVYLFSEGDMQELQASLEVLEGLKENRQ